MWGVVTGGALFYLSALLTPYGFNGIYDYFWGMYPLYGPIPKAFLLFFFSVFSVSLWNFVSAYRKERPGIRKTQIRLIAIAFLISFMGSVDYLPKMAYIPIYPIGYLCVLFWILTVAYTIIRYKVMDIQTVIHKTIMWLLASSIMGVPTVLFYHFNKDWVYQLSSPAYLMLISVTFVIVVLYTRHVQPRIDHFFQRRQWDLTLAMEQFNDELVHLRSLDEVLNHISRTVKTVLYASQVSVLVRDERKGVFTVYPAKKRTGIPIDSLFLKWLERNDVLVFEDYLTLDPRLEGIKNLGEDYFRIFNSILCIPLVINQKLVGILNIGQKENLQSFRTAETDFLSELRRSGAVAISNSLHLIAMQENLRRWNEELEKKVDERTKQLEQTQAQLVQAEKLATIGTLAGGVAHEINNPLTAVLTNAQILKMTAQGEDLESIELIEEGAKRCQVIIQNLLKYARKSGGESLDEEVRPHQVIQNVCSLLAYQFKQENIDVVLDLKVVPTIRGVSNELEQVVTNLLVNARDAIRDAKRKGKISVSTREANGKVEIEVSDNGVGISKDVLSKIFDPFFTTKEVGGGTGLGLAVSYSIIQKYQGQITVRSDKGRGTTFLLRFPIMDLRKTSKKSVSQRVKSNDAA